MRRPILKLALLLSLVMLACGNLQPPPTATPIPTLAPAPTAVPLSGTPVAVDAPIPNQFAAYEPVVVDGRANAPAYVVDLAAVTNSNVLQLLNGKQQTTLAKNGFVVVPEEGWEQIYDIYQATDRAGQPVFVTTDALLHTFHILYDYALRQVELNYLMADLAALNQGMVAASLAQLGEAEGSPAEEAAWRNVAFFSVGGRLLNPDFDVPDPVGDVVQDELSLINQAGGVFTSPLFGLAEDYSQYIPRGHYTRNEAFGRYFRAMMWYGRMPFSLHAPDEDAVRLATQQALLIVQALNSSSNLSRWERIYLPTTFFVGVADDLTVYDYQAVAQAVYGGFPGPVDLADQAQLDSFIATARNLPRPQILSQPVNAQNSGEDAIATAQSFRFMGQRFIPDSAIMQQLVFNRVGVYNGATAETPPLTAVPTQIGLIRGFPRGLDVAAILGSARALAILQEAGDTSYEGYDVQMATLQSQFAALDEAAWTQNLYWGWLYSLQPLLSAPPEGTPVFMNNLAWQDRQLNTWFGSWAELRHDTILYAKQSESVGTGAPAPSEPRGYVEPQPAVYARLAALARQMHNGLQMRGLLDEATAEKLAGLEELLLALQTISEKELRGEELSQDEYDLIRYIGGRLEALTTYADETADEFTSETDERMAIIADVHTDVNSGQVLEVGVGDAWPIYVVVLVEGQQVVTVGGVFSTYEFKQPLANRLTDEEWQAMEQRPERPGWTDSFVVP